MAMVQQALEVMLHLFLLLCLHMRLLLEVMVQESDTDHGQVCRQEFLRSWFSTFFWHGFPCFPTTLVFSSIHLFPFLSLLNFILGYNSRFGSQIGAHQQTGYRANYGTGVQSTCAVNAAGLTSTASNIGAVSMYLWQYHHLHHLHNLHHHHHHHHHHHQHCHNHF